MKKERFKIIVIALAIVTFAVSCGSGTSNKQGGSATETKTETQAEQTKSGNGVSASSFVGKWTDATETNVFEFKKDGSGVLHYLNDASKKAENFTWKVSGKKASLDFEGGSFNQFEYVNDNLLEDMMSRPYTKYTKQ